MERSAIREQTEPQAPAPDFAALHPGYACLRWAQDQQRTTPGRAARCAASGERGDDGDGLLCRFASPQGAVIVRLDRTIQYAAAFRFYHSCLGILDHPLSRVMTTENVARSSSGHTSAFSRRDAPEGCVKRSPCKNRWRGESRG